MTIWKEAAQDQRANQQSIVPKRANVIFGDRLAHNSRAIVNFKTQGEPKQLQKMNPKRDQPSGFPAFDLQDFLRARRPAV